MEYLQYNLLEKESAVLFNFDDTRSRTQKALINIF